MTDWLNKPKRTDQDVEPVLIVSLFPYPPPSQSVNSQLHDRLRKCYTLGVCPISSSLNLSTIPWFMQENRLLESFLGIVSAARRTNLNRSPLERNRECSTPYSLLILLPDLPAQLSLLQSVPRTESLNCTVGCMGFSSGQRSRESRAKRPN